MFCNKNNIKWDNLEGLKECAKTLIKPKRFKHILGVEEECIRIAGIYNCGGDFIYKLRAAALLHDITKEFDYNKQLEICGKYNIHLSGDGKRTVKSLHAKTGAYVARIEFGADDMIFEGIFNHTLGCFSRNSKEQELFDKIAYLADWIEPNRKHPDCIEVREFFNSSIENARASGKMQKEKNKVLNAAMLFALNKSIEALIKNNLFIHKDTIKSRNALINKRIMV